LERPYEYWRFSIRPLLYEQAVNWLSFSMQEA
jgi:hypothetical protein